MTLKRFSLPDYSPDTPLGIAAAANLTALPQGYRPDRGFSAVTSALVGILGGASAIGSDGTSALLGGTATNLYSYATGSWVSVLGSLSAASWRFAQFGDNLIGVNGGVPVKYNITAGTAAVLGGSPPTSDMVATVRQQVFLAGDLSARNTVSISGYNDSEGWSAGVNQSLVVPFPSGGDIMGLAGGETGIILQRRSIKRATYNGDGVTWWQFDEISRDVGCMAKGSVAQAGQLVFFLSDEGFKVTDRNDVFAIGNESIDRTFFASYARQDIVDSIQSAVDPQTTTVTWSMPGNPGRLWRYNWTLKKWSPPLEDRFSGVFQGFSRNYSLEDLDSLYPSGLDSIPVSLDATIFAGGNPLLFVIDNGGQVGTMTGDIMGAYVSLAPDEVETGRRVRIKAARVVGDPVSGSITIDARARAGDREALTVSGAIRDNGDVPLRCNGRHIGIRIDIPAGADWSYLTGVDLDYAIEGAR